MNKIIRVLVIDDSSDDRELYRRALHKSTDAHYDIIGAEDGEKGLAHIVQHAPDCILLDYSLPGHNGIEVLKRIHALHPHIPVVMLTGQGNETVAVAAMREGAQNYISKSTITPDTIHRAVEVAIWHCSMEKRISQQQASLEIFTRALAHDLKEPVRTIRSFLDRITDSSSLSERSQQFFDYVHKAADRMSALIDAVYLYTRLDAAEQMVMTKCDVTSLLEAVQENLAQLIEDRGAKITWDALPCVHGNRVHMIQLFQNLVTNAIRHCDTPVTVHVSAEECEDHWRLVVRDNGPGIAPEQFEKIFDPFKRFSQGDEPGFGLGLAISRKVVEAHGGTIWCESENGAGTSFYFTSLKRAVPRAAENGTLNPMTNSISQTTDRASKPVRILLVDDNKADIVLNQILLVEEPQLGCDVLTARDGREALVMQRAAKQEGNPIDLVILDINMPVMSGLDLLREMNKEQALLHTLVVMCSTSNSDIDQRQAASLGAIGYLTKPPGFSEFKDIMERSKRLRVCEEGPNPVLRRVA